MKVMQDLVSARLAFEEMFGDADLDANAHDATEKYWALLPEPRTSAYGEPSALLVYGRNREAVLRTIAEVEFKMAEGMFGALVGTSQGPEEDGVMGDIDVADLYADRFTESMEPTGYFYVTLGRDQHEEYSIVLAMDKQLRHPGRKVRG